MQFYSVSQTVFLRQAAFQRRCRVAPFLWMSKRLAAVAHLQTAAAASATA